MFRFAPGRSADRRRRWTLALAYTALLASCESPFAPVVQDVSRLEVTPAVLQLVEGANATLTARVFGPDDVPLAGVRVFWSSQDPGVVTVDQSGVATAVAPGTAQIAASSGGQSRTIAVTVSQRPIALVRITPPAGTVIVGGTLALTGEALDGTGTLLPNRLLEWSSSAPEVATVGPTGIVTGVSIGQATITAGGEGRTGTAIVTVIPVPVATISVEPDGVSLAAGQTLTLIATPRDGSGRPLAGRTLEWRSSDDAVATVSAAGLLTAISPGTVTISVTAPGGGPDGSSPSASVSVTVLLAPVASAVIVPSPVGVQVGQDVALTVNLFDAQGQPLSPSGRLVEWASSNPAVATVNATGTVTGVSVGTASVTVTITTPQQPVPVEAVVDVTVSSQPVASIQVTPNPATVHVGYVTQLTARLLDAQGQALTGRTVVWTSSNQSVASVTESSGIVVGASVGSVQIRATSEGVQATVNVNVDLVQISSVGISPPASTLLPGQQVQLTASARDSAANPITGPALGGRAANWSSSNPAVATVSASGEVSAVAQGVATITGTIATASGQATITVNALPSATQLALITPPSSSAPNDAVFAVQPVVQLRDANGNPVAVAGVAIQAAITPPGTGTLGGSTTAVTDATGTATFAGLKITGSTGPRTLTFTAGPLTPAVSGAITVLPGAPTQLTITTHPPAAASSGQAFATATVVQLRDISGNPVPQAGVAVTASVAPSAGMTLGGGTTTTDATGAATFGALTLTGPAGNYTLHFASGALTPASSTTVVLSAGSGSRLVITTQPSASAANGAVLATQPVLQLVDGSNNPVAQAGVSISAAIFSGGGSLGGTTLATTNPSGTAAFTNLSITGTVGPRTLLFGAPGFTAVTSNSITIVAGAPAALGLATPPSASAQSGVPFGTQPAIQLRDASGNAVPQAGVTVAVSLSGAGGSLIGTASASTDANGLATFSGLGIAGTIGSYALTFTSGALTPVSSGSITLAAGPPSQLSMTTQPGGAASGAAFGTQPAVQVRDAQGNAVAAAGITVTAAIASGGPATLLGSGTATTNGSGLATFAGLGLSGTAGNYTIGFSAPSLNGVTSATVVLGHGTAAQLVIITQPSGAASGAAFGTQPVIEVRDAQSNPVTIAGTTITASVAGGGASLVGSGTASTNALGTATFSGLGLSGPVGNYALNFSASGVPTVTSATFALAAGAPAKLVMSTQPPGTHVAGTALSPSPAVQVQDGANNPLTTNGVNVTVSISAGGATLTGSTSALTTNGIATFSGLGITGTAGSYTLTFNATGLTGVTSSSITVAPGAATQLSVTTQPAGATSGSAFVTQPAVQLRDAGGNAVSQSGVSISVAVGTGPGATLSGTTTATTNGSGLATFSGLALTGTAGSYTLSFTSTGLTGISSGAFTLGPGAPAQLSIQTQPAGAVSGAAFTTQPSVLVRDAQNNAVGAGITVSASISGGSGASLIGSTSASTNASGVATFSGLGLQGLVGSYTLDFSTAGAPNVTSGSIALGAGAATQLAVATQPSSPVASGSAFGTAPAVQLRDGGGNAVSQAGVNVTVGIGAGASLTGTATVATDAAGVATFTGLGVTGLVGSYTLAFSASGLTGTSSASFTVTPGPATQLAMVTQPSATSLSGSAFGAQPSVRLRDAAGNDVSQAGVGVNAAITGSPIGISLDGTVSASTNGSGVATFTNLGITGAGTWTLTFTSPGLTSTTSASITVTEPATQLAVVAQPSANAQSGIAFGAQPSVQLRSASNAPVSQAGVTITVELSGGSGSLFGSTSAQTDGSGTATFSGLGISGTIGNYSLTFKSAGLSDASSGTIALAAGAPAKLVVSVQPVGGSVAQPTLSPQPAVQVLDAANNVVPTAGIAVSAALNDPGSTGATLGGNSSASTDGTGTAVFGNLSVATAGTFSLTFTSPGLAGATSASFTVTSFEFAFGDGARTVTVAAGTSGTPAVGLNTLGVASTVLAGPRVRTGRSRTPDAFASPLEQP